VLVTSTDIRSATKARALSQCLGALAAAVVSTLYSLPWFGTPRAQKTLGSFQQQIKAALQQDAEIKDAQQRVHDSLDEMLDARLDMSSIQEA
jgi:F0F1-type ATP synthase membrane subunit b/b'